MSTSKRGPRKQSSTSKRSNNNNGRTGGGGSNRATKNPKSRSNQGYRGADDRKPQGGAPRKYKKKPSARNGQKVFEKLEKNRKTFQKKNRMIFGSLYYRPRFNVRAICPHRPP